MSKKHTKCTNKKTFLSVAKIVCGDRVLAYMKVGVYQAHSRAELERNASIMKKGQEMAMPVILDDAETNNPTGENYELLFNAIEAPKSMQVPTNEYTGTLVIHADTEDDAFTLVSGITDISNTHKSEIAQLGLSTNDLVNRIDGYKDRGMTSEQAIATLKRELENQRGSAESTEKQ